MRSPIVLWTVLLASCAGPAPQIPARAPEPPPARPDEILRRISEHFAQDGLWIEGHGEEVQRGGSGEERRSPFRFSLRFKSGGRVHCSLSGTRDGSPVGATVIANGQRIAFKNGVQVEWGEAVQGEAFARELAAGLLSVGCARTVPATAAILQRRAQVQTGTTLIEVVDVQAGPEENGTPTLRCRARAGGRELAITLAYDRQTCAPLRRTESLLDGAPGTTFVETYERLSRSAATADDSFILPPPGGPRRLAVDRDGWSIGVEVVDGRIGFIALADAPLSQTPEGFRFQKGGLTMNLAKNGGLWTFKSGRMQFNGLPAGWDHDLVAEYDAYCASHPGTSIRAWLAAVVRERPAAVISRLLE